MISEKTVIAVILGGVFLLMLGSALVRVLWPGRSLSKWLDEREARHALSRRRGDVGGGGGWFDSDCGGSDGGGGGD